MEKTYHLLPVHEVGEGDEIQSDMKEICAKRYYMS